jgi:hypothetical protein
MMKLDRNPYFYACPIHAALPGSDQAITASSFMVRAEGALHLVLPAHFASCRGDLKDLSSWLAEFWIRPSPDAPALKIALFEGETRERPLFNMGIAAAAMVDVISLKIPGTLAENFAANHVFEQARAPAIGEEVFFFGFPNIFERWPGPSAWPDTGVVDGDFTCTTRSLRGVCGGYSGSAMLSQGHNGNNDLVGMIAAGEGRNALFIPGDVILAVVNDLPMPRRIPVHVEGRSHSLVVGG